MLCRPVTPEQHPQSITSLLPPSALLHPKASYALRVNQGGLRKPLRRWRKREPPRAPAGCGYASWAAAFDFLRLADRA